MIQAAKAVVVNFCLLPLAFCLGRSAITPNNPRISFLLFPIPDSRFPIPSVSPH
ncbi:hypothetical protein [Moorena producens]|uniref:hypothetical protein n=1 Tax=Moorena producens TaxID=1155739 RepID=UPI0013140E5F|nr:hypothetical protein [Moorena producens]